MKKLLLGLFLISGMVLNAQKMKITSGDLGFLKDQKELKVKFDYSEAKFFKENMSEAAYIDKRVSEISKEKGSDEAKTWKQDWKNSKEGSFQDKFISAFEKNSDIKIAAKAPYTLIVETVWIYPGWFGGVMKQPAKVSTNLKFVDSKNPKNVLAVVESVNAPGDGNFIGVPNTNDRIAEGYAKTAKTLAGFIKKKAK